MTEIETRKILATIFTTYKRDFSNYVREELDALLRLWNKLFENTPYDKVSAAVESYIFNDTSGHAPKPGDINAIMKAGEKAERMDAESAWRLVRKAARNGNYHAGEEFAKLPPAVQAVIGGPWAIEELANFSDEQMSKEERTFKRAYEEELERDVSYSPPQRVKDISSGLADKFKLGS